MTVSADSKLVYSVNEDASKRKVSAFGYSQIKGKLDILNSKKSMGADSYYFIKDVKKVIL